MKRTAEGPRLLVTSVVRHSGREEATGYVRVVDLGSQRVLMKSSLPESVYRGADPNPRGGLRGARGVACHGGRLVIANTERLLVYDTSWKTVGDLTHPWTGGIHDVLAEAEGIWVTCASADLLVKLSWDGRLLASWEWRREPALRRAFGFSRLPAVERHLDFRDPETMRSGVRNIVHLNAVSRVPEGLLVSLGRVLSRGAYRRQRVAGLVGKVARALGVPGRARSGPDRKGGAVREIGGSSWAIVLLREGGGTTILKRAGGTRVPNHNVVRLGSSLVYNDTNYGMLTAAALDPSVPDRSVRIPGHPAFVRGLAGLGEQRFLVGSQAPAAVYEVDLVDRRIVSALPLDRDPRESIYGICVLPAEFDDPPPRLG